ncbi:Plasma membrane calcium-transporting ATPase, partial [Spraguea lophii 42_110]
MEDDFFSITNEDLVNMFNNKELIYQNRIISLEDLANLLYIDLENGVCKIDDTKILFAKMSDMKQKVHNVEEAYKILNRKVFGENDVQLKSQKTFINILKSNMNDKTLIILTIAAMFSIAIGIGKMFLSGEKFGVVEGVSILVAVVIIVLVGTINEYSQEILFRNLEKKKTEKLIKIYKNKNLETIHISDITVGDIVYLEAGDLIPADCILVSKNPLFCDESLVTGEVEGIEKNINHLFLMSGSYVMNGLGRAMVICVGENSFKGKILKSLEVERKNTPLQEKIEVLTSNIAMKAIYISIILFIAQLLKLFFVRRIFKIDYVLEIFIESIALAAMAIPEGLPIAITLALSFGTKRML